MNSKEIKSLIRLISSKKNIHELNIKLGDIEIYIKNKDEFNDNSIKKSLENESKNSENKNQNDDFSKFLVIKSPMIGTFYRKPSPEEKPYINIGDIIKPGLKLCVIEAMKLFNSIESEVHGKIVKIFVEDNSPVEYDQPLFLIDTFTYTC